ncbi:hypothetical protein VNO80_05465 [Phaseolus coccineus]|uniref:Uncharacterized protein n=1 Tax=Phaseolus coccineus TaxID=3886 RepID=A0AAN9RGR1_PHACN
MNSDTPFSAFISSSTRSKYNEAKTEEKERLENRRAWARRRIISKAPSNIRPPRVSLNLRTAALKRPYLILPTLTPFAFWILLLSELYLASLTVTLANLTVALADDVDLFHWMLVFSRRSLSSVNVLI